VNRLISKDLKTEYSMEVAMGTIISFGMNKVISYLILSSVWCNRNSIQQVFTNALRLVVCCRLARFYADAQELLLGDAETQQLGQIWKEMSSFSNFMETLRNNPYAVSGRTTVQYNQLCESGALIKNSHAGRSDMSI